MREGTEILVCLALAAGAFFLHNPVGANEAQPAPIVELRYNMDNLTGAQRARLEKLEQGLDVAFEAGADAEHEYRMAHTAELELLRGAAQGFDVTPVAVTAEQWQQAVDVMPPMRQATVAGIETFTLAEPYSDQLYTRYVRVGDERFAMLAHLSESPRQMLNRAKAGAL